MVEAAIVFPLVILAVFSIIYICNSLFLETKLIALSHIEVREDKNHSFKKNYESEVKGLIKDKIGHEYDFSWYSYDEVEIIRLREML